jgi:siroheme synthase
MAGIPLTHRGLASSAVFVTAHDLGPGSAGDAAKTRLAHLARGAETLVLFMAGAELTRVKKVLLEAGLAPGTPAALIENGTLPEEILALGTLQDLDRLGEGRGSGPLLGVIGPTVSLSLRLRPGMETLPWAGSLLREAASLRTDPKGVEALKRSDRGRRPNLERRVG